MKQTPGARGDGDGEKPSADVRDQLGRQRNAAAADRDRGGAFRDRAAERRDESARQRDDHLIDSGTAQSDRVAAADDREHAGEDRAAAAADRVYAAGDRQQALEDLMAAARDRRAAGLDSLTGVYNRQAGLLELDRDLSRMSRTAHRLVVAFVDVDRLKHINDTRGHAAGDQALTAVAAALTAALRRYDLVIRYGGDEFLCVVEDVDVTAARIRFARIDVLLAAGGHHVTVSVGLAQLQPAETRDDLIARADADLYLQRQQRRQRST